MTPAPVSFARPLAKRRCVVCRRRLGDGQLVDVLIVRLGLIVIHLECDGNPVNPDPAHEERERRKEHA